MHVHICQESLFLRVITKSNKHRISEKFHFLPERMSKLPTFFLAVANLTKLELSCKKKKKISNFCCDYCALIAGDVLHTGYFQTGIGLFCWEDFHQTLKEILKRIK